MSLECFKEKLTKETVPIPHSNYGNRTNILHPCLQLNCCDLNEDKSKIGLTDDPTCTCGTDKESADQYLKCNIHILARTKLLTELNKL